ncbi:hypothetical protein JOC86_004101 [Bacillus pakistanensis]|uniref:Uncharacterized protein n=1 Tax=Rossellomorea pakistanensis TaxID=992288 RepID=A0ABS2NI80_9BACI|nr:hypothetical protein [Bacillus pakistanensis]MBM7587528.1 hypothetical protein [Bacillus pakistanensis]
MIWIIALGFLVNGAVFFLGVFTNKVAIRKTSYPILLIANAIFASLAFVFGFTGGYGTFVNPDLVMTVGIMSFGMVIFCLVPALFIIREKA